MLERDGVREGWRGWGGVGGGGKDELGAYVDDIITYPGLLFTDTQM